MAVRNCISCRRLIEIEPVECPYCAVIQDNNAFEARLSGPQRLITALAGILAGTLLGYLMGTG